ncbi:MAG TPA: SchA/CurD-like domain-containing protein [Candidatus Thermoplasmatota archaeon]|nr:SchA/CurD-like domain-containing protein [Candidatus Thermoplasmatota archaeon]
MLVCFTFEAKPGKEAEFERLLNNAEGGRKVARAMGAKRNSLFLKGGRMVRVFEFPEGQKPVSLGELAKADKDIEAFLRALGPLIKDGFDFQAPGSLEAFNQRALVPLAYDVRP